MTTLHPSTAYFFCLLANLKSEIEKTPINLDITWIEYVKELDSALLEIMNNSKTDIFDKDLFIVLAYISLLCNATYRKSKALYSAENVNDMMMELVNKMIEISTAKSHDYAGEADPLSNFKYCENAGIPAWKGVIVRLGDKLSRIKNFAQKQSFKVKDESVEDTLVDLANYALLCVTVYDQDKY